MDTYRFVRVRNETINYKGGTIAKNEEHGLIDSKGTVHYFVKGNESETYNPYYKINDKRNSQFEKEALQAVMQNSLIKNMVSSSSIGLFMIIALVMAGFSGGLMVGQWIGGDTISNNDIDNNYNDNGTEPDSTVITVKSIGIRGFDIEGWGIGERINGLEIKEKINDFSEMI